MAKLSPKVLMTWMLAAKSITSEVPASPNGERK